MVFDRDDTEPVLNFTHSKNKMEEEEVEKQVQKIESPKSPTILPWDKFSNWLHCACVVTFDLELGQAMEVHTF